MTINLLSILGGGGKDAGAGASQGLFSYNNAETGQGGGVAAALDGGEGESGFDELFEGKLAELNQLLSDAGELQGEQALPAPKMLAALLQRLHLVQPGNDFTPNLPQLPQEQITAMAEAMGIDAEALSANAAESAGQIFPQGMGIQSEIVEKIMSLLQEIADLGASLQDAGMTLVNIDMKVGPLEEEASAGEDKPTPSGEPILDVLREKQLEAAPVENPLSESAQQVLQALFGITPQALQEQISNLRKVSMAQLKAALENRPVTLTVNGEGANAAQGALNLPQAAAAPGMLDLLAHLTGLSREELWQAMEQRTDGEADFVFDMALFQFQQQAGWTPPRGESIQGAFVAPNSATPTQEAISPLGEMALKPDRNLAPGETPEALLSKEMQTGSALEKSADKANSLAALNLAKGQQGQGKEGKSLPFAALQAQAAGNDSALNLRRDALTPLWREAWQRPLTESQPFEASSSSSLSVSSLESRLDADSRLRETHLTQQRRAPQQAARVQEQVMVQVKDGLSRGDTHIRVQLNPAELGRVDVKMEVNADGRATLAIVADNRDTLDMLQRDSRALERAFQSLGLEMGEGGMSFDLGGEFAGNEAGDESPDTPMKEGQSSFDAMLDSPEDRMAQVLLDGFDDSALHYVAHIDDHLNIKV